LSPLAKRKSMMLFSSWLRCCASVLPKTFSESVKSFFLLGISTLLTFHALGINPTLDKTQSALIDMTSLIVITLSYLLLHFFLLSPVKAYKQYRQLGFWDGNTFHYHKEVRVYTGVIHPNGQKLLEVTFPPECKDMFVSTNTVISGAHQRVKVGFTCMQDSKGHWLIPMTQGISRSSIRLDKRTQYLVTESMPGTIPTRVKVYLESWTL